MNLENKIAIVTGAGQGIGKGIALALANQGAKVVASDLVQENAQKVAGEINQNQDQVIAVKCDVSQKNEIENLFQETQNKFNGLDILVNNAGIFPFKAFTELSEDDWDKVMDVNLKSVFLCSQQAAKAMEQGGKIINISSIASIVGYKNLTHYCASKSGINGLTRALALELAPKINVNAIAPGAINTPGANVGSNEEIQEQTIAAIPLARMGEPEDIANMAVFLASDSANYITGQIFTIDGGYTLQ